MVHPTFYNDKQEDKWVIPESMMEYEKKIVALEQRCKELEAENALLRKRLEPIEASRPQGPLECGECHQMMGGPA